MKQIPLPPDGLAFTWDMPASVTITDADNPGRGPDPDTPDQPTPSASPRGRVHEPATSSEKQTMHRKSTAVRSVIHAQAAAPVVADELQLLCRLDVEAAADPSKPAKISSVGYSGGLMRPAGWPEGIVVDLAGLQAADYVPLVEDHRMELSSVLGSVTPKIDRTAQRVTFDGFLASGTAAADHARKLAGAGVRLQASIGARIIKSRYIRHGEKVTVNGQTFDGPVTVADESELYHLSLVAQGADRRTSVDIHASAAPTQGGDVLKAERERVAAILAATAPDGFSSSQHAQLRELQARGIAGELTVEAVQSRSLELLRAGRAASVPGAHAAGQPVAPTADAIVAGILTLVGRGDVAAKAYDARTLEAAAGLRFRHSLDIAEAILEATGRRIPHERTDLLAAALHAAPLVNLAAGGGGSTISMPVAFSDAMNKILVAEFADQEATWRSFCRVHSSQNFHASKPVRMVNTRRWDVVGEMGELKHGVLNEAAQSVSPRTEGQIIGISRQKIINDDIGILATIPSNLAIGGARAISDDVFTVLLANAGSFFATGNGNYFEGSGTALSVDSLGAAIQAMRQQTDEAGRPIAIRPTTLVVGPALEQTAKAVLNSTEILGTSGPSGNPVAKAVALEVEARIENATFPGYSALHWYLMGPAAAGAVNIVFVGGRQSPVIESQQADFDTLGMNFRGYLDFGSALGEYRAAVRMKGEA